MADKKLEHSRVMDGIVGYARDAKINNTKLSEQSMQSLAEHLSRYVVRYESPQHEDREDLITKQFSRMLHENDSSRLKTLYTHYISDLDKLIENPMLPDDVVSDTIDYQMSDEEKRITNQYAAAKWIAEDLAILNPDVVLSYELEQQRMRLADDLVPDANLDNDTEYTVE